MSEKKHSDVELDLRHPNGVPRTIDHWEEDDDGNSVPVHLDEIGGHSEEELKALGYSAADARKKSTRRTSGVELEAGRGGKGTRD